MSIRSKFLASAVSVVIATPAVALPLDAMPGDLRIDVAPTGPALSYIEDGAGGADLVLDPLTIGFDDTFEDYYFDLFLTFEPEGPEETIFGALSIYDDADGGREVFGGNLAQYGTVPGDVVQLLFLGDGSVVSDFASTLVFEFAFETDLPGDDPLRTLADGERYGFVGAVSDVASVPVPASLPLLIGGAVAFAAVRGRRKPTA